MAMYLSQKWAKKALSWIGGIAETPPLSLTARMWTVAPDETGTGGTEVTGGGYAPPTIALGTPVNGTAGLVAKVLNSAVANFYDMPVASSDVVACSLHDEVGDLVVLNDAWTPPAWAVGANPQVDVGALLLGFTK